MNDMISFCGLNCRECPAYIATRENDDAKRQKVAVMWSKLFKTEIPADAINCDGCRTEGGRLFGHCTNCAIRSCGMEKGVENCAHCADYSCAKLDGFLEFLPNKSARENLERIKKGL